MTQDALVMEETPISDKVLTALHAPPATSPLLSEWQSPGEPFAHFFASTTMNNMPPEHAWLLDKDVSNIWSTTLLEESSSSPAFFRWEGEPEQQVPDPIVKTNADRVQLLARKYVAKDKFSEEETARLAILTERVRQLLPSVTIAEYEALEQHLEKLNTITDKNAQLRARLMSK